MLRAHVTGDLGGGRFYVYGWDGVSWQEILSDTGSVYDRWVDVPPGITQLKTCFEGFYWRWVDVPEVEVEEEVSSP